MDSTFNDRVKAITHAHKDVRQQLKAVENHVRELRVATWKIQQTILRKMGFFNMTGRNRPENAHMFDPILEMDKIPRQMGVPSKMVQDKDYNGVRETYRQRPRLTLNGATIHLSQFFPFRMIKGKSAPLVQYTKEELSKEKK